MLGQGSACTGGGGGEGKVMLDKDNQVGPIPLVASIQSVKQNALGYPIRLHLNP